MGELLTEGIGKGVDVGEGVGVGACVGVAVGVGVGVGIDFLTTTPLPQTNFLPDLMHVYFFP